MNRSMTKWSFVGMLVVLCLVVSSLGALAQDETAAAGNGGTADCSANGGAVAAGDTNSGANLGSAIGVGDSWGDVLVDGGAMANATDLGVAVDGGTGICDASGGEENDAFLLDVVVVVPEPDPVPPPPPPVDDFQVCVTLAGSPEVCGPGTCTGPSDSAACFPDDCAAIDPSFEAGCEFGDCDVIGNTGFCFVEPG